MKKNVLSDYRSIVREIEEIEIRMKNETKHSKVTGSDPEFPYTKHTISVSGVRCSEDNGKSLARLMALKEQKECIERFVESIPDSITRRIFSVKYIEGDRKISWNEVADIIGGGNTSDSIRMIVKRYLEKICKN